MADPKAKILVIEDEEDFRSLASLILKREGYRVFAAANGEEGMRLCAQELPDLVLLDLRLPDMDGYDVCRNIRKEKSTAGIPVIICSIRSEVAPVAEGLACGADDYILKPFNVEDLLTRIRTALGKGE